MAEKDPPRLSLRDDQATCDVELDLWEGRTAHGAGTSVGSEGNEQGMPSRQDMDDEARVKMAQAPISQEGASTDLVLQDLICMGQPLEAAAHTPACTPLNSITEARSHRNTIEGQPSCSSRQAYLQVCVQALRLANDDLEQAMAWLLSPAAARMAQQMEAERLLPLPMNPCSCASLGHHAMKEFAWCTTFGGWFDSTDTTRANGVISDPCSTPTAPNSSDIIFRFLPRSSYSKSNSS